MAAGPPVKVYGLDEFARGARKLAGNIDEAAGDDLQSVADMAANTVRATVPRRTGRMAGSVSSGRRGRRAAVSYGVPYAGWIDYGGTRGRPYVRQGRYLYPTARAAADEAERASEDAARKEIRTMIWPRPNKW